MLHETFLPLKLLHDVDFEEISIEELNKKIDENAKVSNLPELQDCYSHCPSFPVRYFGETTEKYHTRCENLRVKKNIILHVIQRLKEQEMNEFLKADFELRSKLIDENISKFRVAVGQQIESMQLGLISEDCIRYEEIQSECIEVRCNSGRTKKFHLKNIKTTYVEEMIRNKGRSRAFTVESEGWFDPVEKKMVPTWNNMGDFNYLSRLREVHATIISVKVV